MGWLRRALIVAVLSALAASVTSSAALAAGNPDRQPLPSPPDVSDTFCGAGVGMVLAHVSVNRVYAKSFLGKDGTLRIEFNGFAQSTVTTAKKSLSFNSSGPATLTFYPDGTMTLIGKGHSFVINPTGPNTGILLVTGRISVDPNTNDVTVLSGNVTDVCALLAA